MASYSEHQKDLKTLGSKNKRGDIVFNIGSTQHTLDIVITAAKKNASERQDPMERQYTRKLRLYGKEPNVYPIVLSVSGNIHPKSWKHISSLGLTIANFRDIQHLIFKYTTYKIQETKDKNIKIWKQRDRADRRRHNKCMNTETLTKNSQSTKGTILQYMEQ